MKRKLYIGLIVLFFLMSIFTMIAVNKNLIKNEDDVLTHFSILNADDYLIDNEEYDENYEYNSDTRKISYTQDLKTLLTFLDAEEEDFIKISKLVNTESTIIKGGSKIKMLYKDDVNESEITSNILPPYVKSNNFVRNITYLSFPVENTRYIFKKENEEFKFTKQPIKLENVSVYVKGKIEGSLYDSFITKNIPHEIFQTFINIYSFDVDFQRDIRNNDTFEIVYDKIVNDEGLQEDVGRVLYTKLNLKSKKNQLEYFILKRKAGERRYYDRKGNALAKTFMKTPVNGARVSSKFGPRRHPILGYSRMHTGMDFSAPTGTAIYAAADGYISFIGWNGSSRRGYGMYTTIKHNNTYSTAYAHQSRFAKNLKHGSRVRQGQVIGYVGSTGYSTGPHLHYEVIKNGTKINPANITSLSTGKAQGKDRLSLEENIRYIDGIVAKNK